VLPPVTIKKCPTVIDLLSPALFLMLPQLQTSRTLPPTAGFDPERTPRPDGLNHPPLTYVRLTEVSRAEFFYRYAPNNGHTVDGILNKI